MSVFTRVRNAVTGTVKDVVQTGVGLATSVTGLGGLTGLLGGQQLPQLSQGGLQSFQGQSSQFPYQQNLESLMNLTGLKAPVSQQSNLNNQGLI